MELSILTFCYLIASVTFILGLKMLSNPATARKGNLVAAAGMTIAIIGTIFLYEEEGVKLGNYGWIFGALPSVPLWEHWRQKSENDRHA